VKRYDENVAEQALLEWRGVRRRGTERRGALRTRRQLERLTWELEEQFAESAPLAAGIRANLVTLH
jgi:hypothetical protein